MGAKKLECFIVLSLLLQCVNTQSTFNKDSSKPRITQLNEILPDYTPTSPKSTNNCLIPSSGGCSCDELAKGYCVAKCQQSCSNPDDGNDWYNCPLCTSEAQWNMWGRKKKSCVDKKGGPKKASDGVTQLESCELECFDADHVPLNNQNTVTVQCSNRNWTTVEPCYPKCMTQPTSATYTIKMKDGTVCKDKLSEPSATCQDDDFTCTNQPITGTGPVRQTGVQLAGFSCKPFRATNKGGWTPAEKLCERKCNKVDTKEIEGVNTKLGADGWNSLDRGNCGTTKDKSDENKWKTEGTICPFDCTLKGTTTRQTKRLACGHAGFNVGADLCEGTCSIPAKPKTAADYWKTYPSRQDGRATARPTKSEQGLATCATEQGYMLAGWPCRTPFECQDITKDMALTSTSYGTTVNVQAKCFDYCDIASLKAQIANSAGCFYRVGRTTGQPINATGVNGDKPTGTMFRYEGDYVPYTAADSERRWLHGRRCEIQCADGSIRRNSPGPYCYATEATATNNGGKGTWKWLNRWGEEISTTTVCDSKATLSQASSVQLTSYPPCKQQYLAILNGKITDTECRTEWPHGTEFDYACNDGYKKVQGDGAKLRCNAGNWEFRPQTVSTKNLAVNQVPDTTKTYLANNACYKGTAGSTVTCPAIKVPNAQNDGCSEAAVGETCTITCKDDYVKMYQGPDQTTRTKWWVWPSITCGLTGKWSGTDTIPICVNQCSLDQRGLMPTSTGFTLTQQYFKPDNAGCPGFTQDDCDGFCNYDERRLDCTTGACAAEETCDKPTGSTQFFTIAADLKVYADRRLSKNAWVGLWEAKQCTTANSTCTPDKWLAAKFLTEPDVATFNTNGLVASEVFDLVDLKMKKIIPDTFKLQTDILVAQVYQDLGTSSWSLMYSSNLCAATKGYCAGGSGTTLEEDDLADAWVQDEPQARVVLEEQSAVSTVDVTVEDDGIDWKHPSALIKHWMKETGWLAETEGAAKNRTMTTQAFHSKNVPNSATKYNYISAPLDCLNTGCRCNQLGDGTCNNECNNAECNFDGWDCICGSPMDKISNWNVVQPTKASDLNCKLTKKAGDGGTGTHTGALTKSDNDYKKWNYEAQTKCSFACQKVGGKDLYSGYDNGPITTLAAYCFPNPNGNAPDWLNYDITLGGPKCAEMCGTFENEILKNLKIDGAKGPYSWGIEIDNTKCTQESLKYPFTAGCSDYSCKETMTDSVSKKVWKLTGKAPGLSNRWACMAPSGTGTNSQWKPLQSTLPWCIYEEMKDPVQLKCGDLLPSDMIPGHKLTVSGGSKCTEELLGQGKCTVVCQPDYNSDSTPTLTCQTDASSWSGVAAATSLSKPMWRLSNPCLKLCPTTISANTTVGGYQAITCTNRKVGEECGNDAAKAKCTDSDAKFGQCGTFKCVKSMWKLTDGNQVVDKQPRCWKQCDCKTLSSSTAFDAAAPWRKLKTDCSASKLYPHGTPKPTDFKIIDANDCEVDLAIACYDGTWMNLKPSGLAYWSSWTPGNCKQTPSGPSPTAKDCTRSGLLDYIKADATKDFLRGTSIQEMGALCAKDKYTQETVPYSCKKFYGHGDTKEFTCGVTGAWTHVGDCKPVQCPPLVVKKADARYKGFVGSQQGDINMQICDTATDGEFCASFQCAPGLVKFWQRDSTGGVKKDSWWQMGPQCKVTETSATWVNIPYCVDPCLGVGDMADTKSQIAATTMTDGLEACPNNWVDLCDGFCTWAATGAAEKRGEACNSLSCMGRELCKPPAVMTKSKFSPTKLCVQWTSNRYLGSSAWVEIKDGSGKTIGARFLYKDVKDALGGQTTRTTLDKLPVPARYGDTYVSATQPVGPMTDINIGFNDIPRDIKFTPTEFKTAGGVDIFAGGNPSATIHYDLRSGAGNTFPADKLCPDENPCLQQFTYKMEKAGFTKKCADKGCSCDDWMDGYCDPNCNNPECGYDGGDCGCMARPEKMGAVRGAVVPKTGLLTKTNVSESVDVTCPANYVLAGTTPEAAPGTQSETGPLKCVQTYNDLNGAVWEEKVCWAPCWSAAPQFDETLTSTCTAPADDKTASAKHGQSCDLSCSGDRTLEAVKAGGMSTNLANTATATCYDGRYSYSAANINSSLPAVTTYTPLNSWYCMDRCKPADLGKLGWSDKTGWEGDSQSNPESYFDCSGDNRISAAMCKPRCKTGYYMNGVARCIAKDKTNFAQKRDHEVEWVFVPLKAGATKFQCEKLGGPSATKCDFNEYYKYPSDFTGSFSWLDAANSVEGGNKLCDVDSNGKVSAGSFCRIVCDTEAYIPVGYPCPWNSADKCAQCLPSGKWAGKAYCQAPCKVAPRFFGYDSKAAASGCIPSQDLTTVMARNTNPSWVPLGQTCSIGCDANKGYKKLEELYPNGNIPNVCAWKDPVCVQAKATPPGTGTCAGGSQECVKSGNMTFNQFRTWDTTGARCFAPCYWDSVSNKPANVDGCIEGGVIQHGSICTPKCTKGFVETKPAVQPAVPLWCNNGAWSGSWAGSCEQTTNSKCDTAMLEDVFNAFPVYAMSGPEHSNRFKCSKDRMLPEGQYQVKCLDYSKYHPADHYLPEYMIVTCKAGNWYYNNLQFPPKCQALKSCPAITDADVKGNLLGDKQCEGTADGQDCLIKCDEGYTVKWVGGDYGPICRHGVWKNIPQCVQACQYAGCDKWKNSEHLCNGVCDAWTSSSKNCAGPSCGYDNKCNKTVVTNVNVQVASVVVRFDANQILTEKAWVGLFGSDEKDGWEKYRWVNKKQKFNTPATTYHKATSVDKATKESVHSYEFPIDIQLDPEEPNNGRIYPDWSGRQTAKQGGKVQLLSFDKGELGWAEDADARQAVKDIRVGVFADGANAELANQNDLAASTLCDYKEKCFDMGLCPTVPGTPIPEPSPPDFDVPAAPMPTVPAPPTAPVAPLTPTAARQPTSGTTDTSIVTPSPAAPEDPIIKAEAEKKTWIIVAVIFIILAGILLCVIIVLVILLLTMGGGGKDTNYHQL